MLAERAVDIILDVPTYSTHGLPPATPLLAAVTSEGDVPSNMAVANSPWTATFLAASGLLLLVAVSCVKALVHVRNTHVEADVYVQA